MDQQQLQMVFMTQVMPLITQGMATGFDCKFQQSIIDLGEQKLLDYVSTFGIEMLNNAVKMVADFILNMTGARHSCDTLSENALF